MTQKLTDKLNEISTEELLSEIEARRNNKDDDAFIRGANRRSKLLWEMNVVLLELVPSHDHDTCSDADPRNFFLVGDKVVKCRRCALLYMEKSGAWSPDLTLSFAIVRDDVVAKLLRKISSQSKP